MAPANDNDAPVPGASGGVGGASPTAVTSPTITKVYLIDEYGYEHDIIATLEEYVVAKGRVKGLTDKYVLRTLKELVIEYLGELDKVEVLKKIEEEAWREGCEIAAQKIQDLWQRIWSGAQGELVEKTYEELPVIWDELEKNHFTVALADGRVYWADWESKFDIFKVGKWKIVEVREE
jgi:hypothetical protein